MIQGKRMSARLFAAAALSLATVGCHYQRVVSGGTGPTCLGPVSVKASITGGTQWPTEVKARQKWSDAVSAASGNTYAHWSLAHAKSTTCKHDDETIRTWTCTASAEPCET